MKTPPFLRCYFASAILVVVACAHVYQHRTINRSAWGAGCGFGMFSTVEHHGTRHVRCTVETASGKETLAIPADVSLRVRALPTENNLTALASFACREAQQRWPSTRAVQIEVWRTTFDAKRRELTLRRLESPMTLTFDTPSQEAELNSLAKGIAR